MSTKLSLWLKRSFYLLLILFAVLNIVACFHAYRFTHYADAALPLPRNPEKLSVAEKIKVIIFGVELPRPKNEITPSGKFETVRIAHDELECWEIPVAHAKGMVLLFHGYGNRKSAMLDRSRALNKMGYRTVLLDFSGSGGSKGNTTTIGYDEGEQVKQCYDHYHRKYPEEPMFMLGTSMGAAAVLKCLNDHEIKPAGIILECPFGSMYQTVCNRFDAMKIPSFPMASLLVFYGGLINGFWAFEHNPIDYAEKVKCPVLLMCGGSDERVSQQEIDAIYDHFQGEKKKVIYPLAGHESYLNHYAAEWRNDVDCFLDGKK